MRQPKNIEDEFAGDFIAMNIAELHMLPVEGVFDELHLRRIHERIFRGFTEMYIDVPDTNNSGQVVKELVPFNPGEYRRPLEGFQDYYCKDRPIVTQGCFSVVSYARLDESAMQMLSETLARANPETLKKLDAYAFADEISCIYVRLDYIHPFPEGNSRTLREFTRELAFASGYVLDWNIYDRNQASRDALYVARDVGVNRIAVARGTCHPDDLKDVKATLARFWNYKRLSELLRNAIRPLNGNLRQQKVSFGLLPAPFLQMFLQEREMAKGGNLAELPKDVRLALTEIARKAPSFRCGMDSAAT